jgi:hypothetical protein
MDGTRTHGPSPLHGDRVVFADHPVRIFPSSDKLFRAAVMAAIAGLAGAMPAPTTALEELLRRDYPAVRRSVRHGRGRARLPTLPGLAQQRRGWSLAI